ncbi:ABC transporter ATP-binding protein [Paenibacillus sp. YYML68]|uniref:ABC transporter ATP-binding protein n=1 Tax=Paenibacillus sp. YYML68 TaxID=2909250 RepID=UPI00248FA209|nr:ABC transporter ATP-binding protein [Paenibacillus sp. YYML68]
MLIGLHQITKMYSADKGVTHINLEVHAGTIHGLIGANGSGKTTLIKIMLNQLKVDSGHVSWEGRTLGASEYQYRKRIGYMPDDEALLDHLTPMEIVRFAGYTYGMEKNKIEENARTLFELLELSDVHSNVNGFSRGMRKKVQLAVAMIHHPKLIILDEPIAGFDPNMIYIIKQLLSELRNHGTTVLVSTHDLHFADQLADCVTMIDQGKLLLTGNKDEILHQYAVNTIEELFVKLKLKPSSKELITRVVANL